MRPLRGGGSVTCSWCEERFERFLDGEVSPVERERFLAHTEGCAGCRSLLEELRVVDGLLLAPHAVEPAPDFTRTTMADIRAMPPPSVPPSPLPAYLVCYVVAAWSLIGAGFVLDPHAMRAFGETSLGVGRTVVVAFGGVLHVAMYLGDHGALSSWTAVAVGVVIVDATLAGVLVTAVRFGALRQTERQRS